MPDMDDGDTGDRREPDGAEAEPADAQQATATTQRQLDQLRSTLLEKAAGPDGAVWRDGVETFMRR